MNAGPPYGRCPASKGTCGGSRPSWFKGKAVAVGRDSDSIQQFRRVVASACLEEKIVGTREAPAVRGRGSQRELREEQARPCGVADRLVVLLKPGNAGGGKGPDFWRVTGRDQQSGDWLCLSTPLRTRRSRKELYLPAKMAMFSESRPMRDRAIVCW